MTPLSTEIMTRGKSVVGNTAIGMLKSRYAPISASVTMRKMMDLCSRANQYLSVSDFRTCATLEFLAFEFAIGRVEPQSLSCGSAAGVEIVTLAPSVKP